MALLESVSREIGGRESANSTAQQERIAKPSSFDEWIAAEYKRRADRLKFFPPEVLGEPCWDMMLDLATAALNGRSISVTSACVASNVPQTTALRWLGVLIDHGLVDRTPDADDRRRNNVAISPKGLALVMEYFDTVIARR